MHTPATTVRAARPSDRPRLALIGVGFNAKQRVLPALLPFTGVIDIVAYDLHAAAGATAGYRWQQVRDNDDLARRLLEQRPTDVLIESPCSEHAEHLRLALAAGAERVVCEKCLAATAERAAKLATDLQGCWPRQQTGILDHYRLLRSVQLLHRHTARLLGDVLSVRVALREAQGVPPHQERSHADGMGNFFHHVVGVGALWFDPDDLIPVEATWARHPEANVPDTYRSARFRSRRTGRIVLEGEVGKYLPRPGKRIHVRGTRGEAWLDRDQGELFVRADQEMRVPVPGSTPDTGYEDLAPALLRGELPAGLLNPRQAAQALHLVEAAYALAHPVTVYQEAEPVGETFVCDWTMTPALETE